MCFSAGASFGSAAVLGTIGILSLRKADTRSQLMFASIPVLFAIQQVSEGLLWLALSRDGYEPWQPATTYFFLFFAQFLWPTWIPVAMFLMEHNRQRKKLLWITIIAGAITSAILLYRLIFLNIHVDIRHHHIHYDIESSPALITIISMLYVIAILAPVFISSVKGARALAIVLTGSLIITKLFYEAYLISVWCFFAATLSIGIVFILRNLQNETALKTKGLQHKLGMH